MAPKQVEHPRRVLAVSLSDQEQLLSRFINDLTGSPPEPTSTSSGPSLAGITHLLPLNTAYYTATVPIWLDLISDPAEWSSTFLAPEAAEVLEVLGGIAVVFPATPHSEVDAAAEKSRKLIREVTRVIREGLNGWEWDGVGLAVGIGEGGVEVEEVWDELCAENGIEYVQVRGGARDEGRNEFGEKKGIYRVREALESNDWAQVSGPHGEGEGDFDSNDEQGGGSTKQTRSKLDNDNFDPESLDFGFDKEDFVGLKKAIWTGDENENENVGDDNINDSGAGRAPVESGASEKEKQASQDDSSRQEEEDQVIDEQEVEKLEGMMRKLQAVRELGVGMTPDQRKRLAARAVEEVMRDLDLGEDEGKS